MPEVSILLPSLRAEAVARVITAFATTNSDVDYEIVVVTPVKVAGLKTVCVHEGQPRGVIAAADLAFKASSGQFLVWWSDDAFPTEHCLKHMVTFLKKRKDPFIGCFRLRDSGGSELCQWAVYGKLYACFGAASRNTIAMIQGYFDTAYTSFWADPDMCMRAWSVGGRVEMCPDGWAVITHIDDSVKRDNVDRYFEKDTTTFVNRWHEKYGAGYDRTDWRTFNTAVPLAIGPLVRLRSGLASVPMLRKVKGGIQRFLRAC